MGLRIVMRQSAVAVGAVTMFVMLSIASVPAFAQMAPPANVDRSTSDALSKYFHKHRLPMVGAQVSTTADGKRHLMLYGFTATDYGKHDAEKVARDFLHDPTILIANRIQVNPRLRKGGSAQQPPPPEDQSAGGERRFPADADWERQVDETLRAGGASPSNDPNLKMPPPAGPAPAPPGSD